jgi:hypothetical protein
VPYTARRVTRAGEKRIILGNPLCAQGGIEGRCLMASANAIENDSYLQYPRLAGHVLM